LLVPSFLSSKKENVSVIRESFETAFLLMVVWKKNFRLNRYKILGEIFLN
jgi:hypothetical protein